MVPKARQPKFWGVPCVPWIPSLSIATNLFLLGSMDKDSYIRFGGWTVIMLIYYVLYGLHASYDVAHEASSSSLKSKAIELEAQPVVDDDEPVVKPPPSDSKLDPSTDPVNV
jgi:APA family basic amino acid/polyamine antiporter